MEDDSHWQYEGQRAIPRRIDKTPKKTYGTIEKKAVIEFGHEDVLQILAEFIKDRYNIIVNEDDFFLDLQEARVNEGYSGNGKNQKARICLVRVEKYD